MFFWVTEMSNLNQIQTSAVAPAKRGRPRRQLPDTRTDLEKRATARAVRNERVESGLKTFASLPDAAFIRGEMVDAIFSISTPTRWRWGKSGLLPKPRRIGRTTLWNVGEIRAALAALEAEQ